MKKISVGIYVYIYIHTYIHTHTHIYIYYLKCKWIKGSNQKTQTGLMDTQQDPYICCLQETHFRPEDTYRSKVRKWKNRFHANGKQKNAREQQSSCQTI